MRVQIALAAVLGLGLAAPGSAQLKPRLGVQGLIGATVIDEDEMIYDEIEGLDPAAAEEGGVETLISLGASGQQSLNNYARDSYFGVEYSFIFSYGVEDRSVNAANGVAVVSIDSSLMLGDLSAGLFLSQSIGGRSRIYVGAGPLLMWGRVKGDFIERPLEQGTEVTLEETDTAVGIGGYLRGGIEFEWPTGGTFGIGVRGFTSSLEFDDTVGDADIQGVQGFVTFTEGF